MVFGCKFTTCHTQGDHLYLDTMKYTTLGKNNSEFKKIIEVDFEFEIH